jgi:hypothetical protein
MRPGAYPIDIDDVTYARAHDPRHVALQRDRTTRRAPHATDSRPVWIVHSYRVVLELQADGSWLASCVCRAAQFGDRCHHLPVALDEELCRRENARVAAAYAATKRKQVRG